jgi:heat shock protein HslJ
MRACAALPLAPALTLSLSLTLAACIPAQEDFQPYYWKLVSIGGQPFAANATMALDQSGDKVFGQAPCNTWSGSVVKEPFPQWNVRNVTATEMACDDLAAEMAFFAGLARATHQAVGIGYLTLTDQKGFTMDFVPATP